MSETNWYSANNEIFNHSELDDAVSDVVDDSAAVNGDIVTVWMGQAVSKKASDYAPNVFDFLAERAYDECGEFANDWPNASKDQESELDAQVRSVIDEWAEKHGLQPTFFRVENATPVRVRMTSDDGDWEEIAEEG